MAANTPCAQHCEYTKQYLYFYTVPSTVGLFSMSPLPRLHHHDVMTIVGLFFIYIPFVTIRRVMLVHVKGSAVALQSSAVPCSRMVRA